MTAPRQILPGATYLLTRRCLRRQFLLRPSATVNQLFEYLVAVAAERFGLTLHAYCVMSNHVHIVATDLRAELPLFNQFLNAMLARAVNASLGRWETFWAPSSYSAVRLATSDDIVKEVAYVLANPVAAGLVRSGRQWPGAWSDPERIGAGEVHVSRPPGFFAKDGDLPPEATLKLTVPPGFASAEAFRKCVTAALEEREDNARRSIGEGRFLGARRVLRQSPFGFPASIAPRRKLRPRVAARNTTARIDLLRAMKSFAVGYREALAKWRAGDYAAVFPPGTYLMRVLHGVQCAGAA